MAVLTGNGQISVWTVGAFVRPRLRAPRSPGKHKQQHCHKMESTSRQHSRLLVTSVRPVEERMKGLKPVHAIQIPRKVAGRTTRAKLHMFRLVAPIRSLFGFQSGSVLL